MGKILERLKNNKTVNLIKTAFISFTLLLSSIPLSSVADVNINPIVTPENGYYFDLGSGQGGWQTDGLWHITTNRAYSPTHSFWYGDENTKTYNTGGTNSGDLMSPAITLASNSQPVLYFWNWYQTEKSQDHDKKVVQISVNDGQWTDLKQITDAQKTWNRETIDLSAYAGNTIRLRFLFDTVDDKLNNFEGWYVDSIEISSGTTSTATPQTPASTPTPTAPADTNLIANPGFETGSTTPVNWNFYTNNGNTPVWDSTTAHNGTKSVKISISGTTDVVSGEVWSDSIPSTSGKTYTVSAWGKSQGAAGTNNPAVRVAEFDTNHKLLRQTSLYFPKGTVDWNQLQTTFTTGDGTAYIGVYANIWNGYGTFWVDDISLTDPDTTPASTTTSTPTPTLTATPAQTSTPTPTPAAPTDTNLVANPGFETGSTTPVNWNFYTNNGNTPAWDSTTVHSGAKSVKISISGTTDVISGDVWSDLLPSTNGKTYTLSVWGKSQAVGGTNNPAVRVAEFDTNQKWLRQTNLDFPKGTVDWNQLQTTFTTGDGTAYIGVYANIWNGYGTFWVDDISLTDPDTTPASTTTSTPTPTPTAVQATTSTPIPTPTPTPSPAATQAPTSTPAPVSNGPTYYVATNGNDGNPGSSSAPWRTIQHAADTVSAGATVYVMGGTYNEMITITRSGSSGNYITFAAYPGQTATIDGTGLVSQWNGIFTINGASYIKIAGFNIVHSGYAGVRVNGGGTSSDIIIEKNYFNDLYSSAMYTESAGPGIIYDGNEVTGSHKAAMSTEGEVVDMVSVNGFEIKNNYIHDNVHAESINAKIGSSNGKIHHNNIKPVESAGIYMDAWTGLEQNLEVYSNVVHDGPGGSRGIAMAVEGGGTLKNIKVYNNIVYNNGAYGINVAHYNSCDANSLCKSGTIDSIQIVGNTVYNNDYASGWGGGIVSMPDYATNIVIRNNIASQNNKAQISVAGSSNTVQNNLIDGSGGISGDGYVAGSPQFVNPSGGDFHIQSSSPAIDKGTSTGAPNVDFDGNSRPQGAGYDIGAYEHPH